MRLAIVLPALICGACFLVSAPSAIGGEQPGSAPRDKEVARLRAELEKLRTQQEKNRAELEALQKRLGAGAKPPAPAETGDEDLEALRRAARKQTGTTPAENKPAAKPSVFKSMGLSLQALNPEISVTGDMLTFYRRQDGVRERWDADFRGLGIHFEGYLDPYTHFKAAVPVNENGTALGEAYLTRYGLLPGVSLTAGKFRQQFGVVNRWHKHGLDQVDFPVPLRAIFGDGGLNQTGFSADWAMPALLGASQALTLQVTNPDNGRLFSEDEFGTPTLLGHYKIYRDLSKDLYVELGTTALVGWNDEWEVNSGAGVETLHRTHPTGVFGLDLAFLWEPTGRMRYRNIEWRSELYLLARELEAPDDSGDDTLNSWGFFTYLQAKVTRTLDIGVRYDYYQPDNKLYAEVPGLELSPLAVADDDQYQWQIAPYITWHQSPFVKYRLQWDHSEGFMDAEPQNRIWFQIVFAIGPHKHERY